MIFNSFIVKCRISTGPNKFVTLECKEHYKVDGHKSCMAHHDIFGPPTNLRRIEYACSFEDKNSCDEATFPSSGQTEQYCYCQDDGCDAKSTVTAAGGAQIIWSYRK